MQVKLVYPQLSEEERSRRIGFITDGLLKLAADQQEKQAKPQKGA